ncbi:MAG: class I SAM-dependent methyltransferase [Balneolales bacterium]
MATIRKRLIRKLRPWFVSHKKEFEHIFHNNKWRDPESRSGHASTLYQTQLIRTKLPVLLKELEVKLLLDIPCGDLNWITKMDLGSVHYTGADIVPDIIEMNKKAYSNDTMQFLILDLIKSQLPSSDLILCRDCLVHLPFADIEESIRNIKKSDATYFLTTTFTKVRRNKDIQIGKWRPLNLTLPPFSWPQPIKIINEGFYSPNQEYNDKSLGLWKIEDLP